MKHGEQDRPLTDLEKADLAAGKDLTVGNGSWISLADLPPETLAEYQEKRRQNLRKKKEAKALANLQAYVDAQREYMGEILGAKMVMIDGLMSEMASFDVQTKATVYDTKKLDAQRMKILLNALVEFEKSANMRPIAGAKAGEVGVDITAIVADLKKSMGS